MSSSFVKDCSDVSTPGNTSSGKTVIIIVNNETGSVPLNQDELQNLIATHGADNSQVSVVRMGSGGVVENATDVASNPNIIAATDGTGHINFTVDGYPAIPLEGHVSGGMNYAELPLDQDALQRLESVLESEEAREILGEPLLNMVTNPDQFDQLIDSSLFEGAGDQDNDNSSIDSKIENSENSKNSKSSPKRRSQRQMDKAEREEVEKILAENQKKFKEEKQQIIAQHLLEHMQKMNSEKHKNTDNAHEDKEKEEEEVEEEEEVVEEESEDSENSEQGKASKVTRKGRGVNKDTEDKNPKGRGRGRNQSGNKVPSGSVGRGRGKSVVKENNNSGNGRGNKKEKENIGVGKKKLETIQEDKSPLGRKKKVEESKEKSPLGKKKKTEENENVNSKMRGQRGKVKVEDNKVQSPVKGRRKADVKESDNANNNTNTKSLRSNKKISECNENEEKPKTRKGTRSGEIEKDVDNESKGRTLRANKNEEGKGIVKKTKVQKGKGVTENDNKNEVISSNEKENETKTNEEDKDKTEGTTKPRLRRGTRATDENLAETKVIASKNDNAETTSNRGEGSDRITTGKRRLLRLQKKDECIDLILPEVNEKIEEKQSVVDNDKEKLKSSSKENKKTQNDDDENLNTDKIENKIAVDLVNEAEQQNIKKSKDIENKIMHLQINKKDLAVKLLKLNMDKITAKGVKKEIQKEKIHSNPDAEKYPLDGENMDVIEDEDDESLPDLSTEAFNEENEKSTTTKNQDVNHPTITSLNQDVNVDDVKLNPKDNLDFVLESPSSTLLYPLRTVPQTPTILDFKPKSCSTPLAETEMQGTSNIKCLQQNDKDLPSKSQDDKRTKINETIKKSLTRDIGNACEDIDINSTNNDNSVNENIHETIKKSIDKDNGNVGTKVKKSNLKNEIKTKVLNEKEFDVANSCKSNIDKRDTNNVTKPETDTKSNADQHDLNKVMKNSDKELSEENISNVVESNIKASPDKEVLSNVQNKPNSPCDKVEVISKNESCGSNVIVKEAFEVPNSNEEKTRFYHDKEKMPFRKLMVPHNNRSPNKGTLVKVIDPIDPPKEENRLTVAQICANAKKEAAQKRKLEKQRKKKVDMEGLEDEVQNSKEQPEVLGERETVSKKMKGKEEGKSKLDLQKKEVSKKIIDLGMKMEDSVQQKKREAQRKREEIQRQRDELAKKREAIKIRKEQQIKETQQIKNDDVIESVKKDEVIESVEPEMITEPNKGLSVNEKSKKKEVIVIQEKQETKRGAKLNVQSKKDQDVEVIDLEVQPNGKGQNVKSSKPVVDITTKEKKEIKETKIVTKSQAVIKKNIAVKVVNKEPEKNVGKTRSTGRKVSAYVPPPPEESPVRRSGRAIKKKSFGDEMLTYDIKTEIKLEEPKSEEEDFDEKDEDEESVDEDYDDPDRLWCICQKPHNNRFMICCDRCEDWFHGSCVGITKALGQQMEDEGLEWVCPKCKKMEKAMKSIGMSSKRVDIMSSTFENASQASVLKSTVLDDQKSISASNMTNIETKMPVEDKKQKQKDLVDIQSTSNKVQTINKNTTIVSKSLSQETTANSITSSTQSSIHSNDPISSNEPVSVPQEASSSSSDTSNSTNNCVAEFCNRPPKADSVYCSNECVLKHAQLSLKILGKIDKDLEEHQIPGASVSSLKSEPRVLVYEKSTGKILSGSEAPSLREVKTWLNEHPGYAALQPGMMRSSGTIMKSVPAPEILSQKSTILAPPQPSVSNVKPTPQTLRVVKTADGRILVKPTEHIVVNKSSSQSTGGSVAFDGEPVTGAESQGEKEMHNEPSPTRDVLMKKADSAVPKKNSESSPSKKESISLKKNIEIITENKKSEVILEKKNTDLVNVKKTSESYQVKKKESPLKKSAELSIKKNMEDNSSKRLLEFSPEKQISENPVTKLPDSPIKSTEAPVLKVADSTTNKNADLLPLKIGDCTVKIPSSIKDSKKTPLKSTAPEKKAGADPEVIRNSVKKTLLESLTKRWKEIGDFEDVTEETLQDLVLKIEKELYYFFNKDTGFKYKSRYRSILFNLRDSKNCGFFRKILNGSITPANLAKMTSEEMANKELAEWRQQEEKKELQAIEKHELDMISLGNQYIMKSHKGEIEIDKDDFIRDKETAPETINSLPTDSVTGLVKDTSNNHKNHIYDANCKICIGQQEITSVSDLKYKNNEKKEKTTVKDSEKDRKNHKSSSDKDKKDKHRKSKDDDKKHRRERSKERDKEENKREKHSDREKSKDKHRSRKDSERERHKSSERHKSTESESHKSSEKERNKSSERERHKSSDKREKEDRDRNRYKHKKERRDSKHDRDKRKDSDKRDRRDSEKDRKDDERSDKRDHENKRKHSESRNEDRKRRNSEKERDKNPSSVMETILEEMDHEKAVVSTSDDIVKTIPRVRRESYSNLDPEIKDSMPSSTVAGSPDVIDIRDEDYISPSEDYAEYQPLSGVKDNLADEILIDDGNTPPHPASPRTPPLPDSMLLDSPRTPSLPEEICLDDDDFSTTPPLRDNDEADVICATPPLSYPKTKLPSSQTDLEEGDRLTPPPVDGDQSPSAATKASDAVTVWKGAINMADVPKFYASAFEVSGDAKCLQDDISKTMDIVGRISPDTVWNYIAQTKKAGNKDILVIRFQPSNEEEKVSYIALYSYLSNKKRYGVIGNCKESVKDFYIVPLASHQPIPQVLLPLDGPGFEDNRAHMLIGVIIRAKQRRFFDHITDSWQTVIGKNNRTVSNLPQPQSPDGLNRSYTPPLPEDQEVEDILSLPASTESEDETKSNEGSTTPPLHELIRSDSPEFLHPNSLKRLGKQNTESEKPKKRISLDERVQDMAESLLLRPEFSSPKELNYTEGSFDQETMLAELNRQIEEHKKELSEMQKSVQDEEMYSPSRSNPDSPESDNLKLDTSKINIPSNLQEILNTLKDKEVAIKNKEDEIKRKLSVDPVLPNFQKLSEDNADEGNIHKDIDLRQIFQRKPIENASKDIDLRILPRPEKEQLGKNESAGKTDDTDLRVRDPRLARAHAAAVMEAIEKGKTLAKMTDEELMVKAIEMENKEKNRANQQPDMDPMYRPVAQPSYMTSGPSSGYMHPSSELVGPQYMNQMGSVPNMYGPSSQHMGPCAPPMYDGSSNIHDSGPSMMNSQGQRYGQSSSYPDDRNWDRNWDYKYDQKQDSDYRRNYRDNDRDRKTDWHRRKGDSGGHKRHNYRQRSAGSESDDRERRRDNYRDEKYKSKKKKHKSDKRRYSPDKESSKDKTYRRGVSQDKGHPEDDDSDYHYDKIIDY